MYNKSSEKENYSGMISKEEIIELAKKKDEGDYDAREKLILSHLWCVDKYVAYYISLVAPKVDTQELYKDLYQEGCFGLIKAVDKYDWRTNNYLATYAQDYIKKYVLKYYSNRVPYIRLPERVFYTCHKFNIFVVEFMAENGRTPTLEESAKQLNVSVNTMKAVMKYRSLLWVQENIEEVMDFDGSFYGERYKNEEEIIQAMFPVALEEFKIKFKPYEKEVIIKYLGLDGNDPKIFRNIGEELGITKEKARRLYHSGIKKLQEAVGVKRED